MNFENSLKLLRNEFSVIEKFQEYILNINDDNIDVIKNFIDSNFDFRNHNSVQKFCHILGTIANIRPNKLNLIYQIYSNLQIPIKLMLNSNEYKYYSIIQTMTNYETKFQKKDLTIQNQTLNDLIEKDNIDEFQTFLSRTNTKFNQRINQQKYFVPTKKINNLELIEYASLFGSIKIFKFLFNQLNEFPFQLKNFAIAGGNYEIIHIIEANRQKSKSFIYDEETLEMAILFHRIEIFEYLIESFEMEFNIDCYNSCVVSNNFIILNRYIESENLYNNFYTLYFNNFLSKFLYDPKYRYISLNISFIEFAVRIDNEEIEREKDRFLNCFSFFNYDSVCQILINIRPDLVLKQKYLIESVYNCLENKLFSIIIFIKFMNEKIGNEKDFIFLIQTIFNQTSNLDNELTQTLLKFDNISVDNEYNPLFFAIRDENINFIKKLLINKKIDVNCINPISKLTPLIYAYKKGNIDIIKCLLNDNSIDVNKRDSREGQSILHHACFDNKIDIVKLLFEIKKKSIDGNLRNDLNQTPLHLAAIENNIEIVEFLVKFAKADIKLEDNSKIFFCF